jgi:toxin YoeB
MISFEDAAFAQYWQWARDDKNVFKKITALITDIQRDPFDGIGKPEPLKHDLSGLWSRRITGEHRLVYQILPKQIIIHSCKFHY